MPSTANTLITELRQRIGADRLDILVNNAAVSDSDGGIDTERPGAFDRLFAVNVRTPFFLIQRLLPLMGTGGRIPNIGSAVTRIALPGELGYAMTKAALATLGRNLANEVGPRGITVNTVNPGADPYRPDRVRVRPIGGGRHGVRRAGHRADRPTHRHRRGRGVPCHRRRRATDDAGWITANTIDATGGSYLGPKAIGA